MRKGSKNPGIAEEAGDGLGYRRVGQRPDAEDHPLGAIQIHGGDEQGPHAIVKSLAIRAREKGAPEVFLELPHREEPGRHVGPTAGEDVRPVQPEVVARFLPTAHTRRRKLRPASATARGDTRPRYGN